MALFDQGRETVEVWTDVEDTDQWGNPVIRPPTLEDVANRPPIRLSRVIVQPVSEDADMSYGHAIFSFYRILCKKFPGRAKSIVRWRGQLWDVRDNPTRRQYTPSTAHDTVFMRARGEEVG